MELVFDKTDFKFNPQKGWNATLSINALKREIIENDAISELKDASGYDFAGLYKNQNEEPYQYRFIGEVSYYLKIFKNLISVLQYHGGYISSKQLFQNELYQLGGFQLLRGFDEQSIYANQYHIGSFELRLLLSTYSYLYLFNDNGYIKTQFSEINKEDYPTSFGAGINLENQNGAFNIAIAVGKTSDSPFEFRRAKIHFGYIAFF